MKTFGLFLLAVSLFATTSTLQAQGTAFTYQGQLQNNGSPADGNYDFQFMVFDNSTSGTQQGPTLTTNATAISNGLFTVTLDFGSVFPGAGRWLDISVRTNGGSSFVELSPRQSLTPTPYAITAGTVTPGAGLAGTYGGAVTLSNSANNVTGTFTGNGTTITNVNALTLNGLTKSNFWQLGGNNVASGQFLGSTNNQPVLIMVNNQPVMRLVYASDPVAGYSPNVIAGVSANFVSSGVAGATILGGGLSSAGNSNSVLKPFGTVLGGYGNSAGGTNAIVGGEGSIADGDYSVALGQFAQADGNSSVSLGQSLALGTASFAAGSSLARADYATALGNFSKADGIGSTAIGLYCDAAGDYSTALGESGTEGNFATALGYADADGDYSFAGGNDANAAQNGCFVWADDSSGTSFSSTAPNQFLIRAAGGVILDGASATDLNFGSATRQMINLFGTSYGMGVQNNTLYQRSNSRFSWYKGGVHSDTEDVPGTGGSVLMTLTSGGLTVNGTLASTSDRNAKEDFAPVNSREVLDKVAALPITKWIYKTDTDTRHIGPMAQDFYAAFAVGPDDKHITTVDEGGVALAAIQGLNQKLENEAQEKDTEIKDLKKQNDSLAGRLNELETMVNRLAASK